MDSILWAMSLDPRDPRFAARVHALDPWWFEFQLEGHSFGGRVPRDTNKVDLFFEWARRFGPVESVLELGAHEGSHTLQLASRAGIRRVVALEGREDNVGRAQLVLEAFGCTNATIRRYDLETLDPRELERFDAVFCSGLLYHLREPWTLVRKLAESAASSSSTPTTRGTKRTPCSTTRESGTRKARIP